MKALTTVAMYGLVPVPPIQDAQALGKNDDQPPMAEDSNAALLAWYRHLAMSEEIVRARLDPETRDHQSDCHHIVPGEWRFGTGSLRE